VILTSSKEHKDLVEGDRLGASAYVQKQVDFDQFWQTIREIGIVLDIAEPAPTNRGI
jgi:DNA-binding NarL/FixJ family response regulator